MSERRVGRRAVVRAVALAGAAGLAGCSGGGSGTGGEQASTDAPEGTTTATATETTTEGSTVEVTAGPTGTATDGDGDEDGSGGSESVGMACYVSDNDYFFRPALIAVPVGTTVSFGVASTCRQRALAYHPDNDLPLRVPEGTEAWASDVMQGSGTFEHTFTVEGVYDYAGLHDTFGQVGTVVVGDPDPAGQPGLEPPQESLPDAARAEIRRLNEEVRRMLDDGTPTPTPTDSDGYRVAADPGAWRRREAVRAARGSGADTDP